MAYAGFELSKKALSLSESLQAEKSWQADA
jgi:hypothetical protein